MSNQPEFSITDKEAEDIAVRLLSTRLMKEVEKIVVNREDIAVKLGVSSSYVAQLFNGDKILTMRDFHRIQKAYKIQIDITFKPIKQ